MQFVLMLVAVAAAMLLDVRASQAYEGPWCAGTSRGHAFVYNCSMRTFDQCVSEVIAGNAIIIDRNQARGKVCLRSRENGNERLPPFERIIVLPDPFEDEGFLHR